MPNTAVLKWPVESDAPATLPAEIDCCCGVRDWQAPVSSPLGRGPQHSIVTDTKCLSGADR